ncbi:hypothetical protein F4779DRAFT_622107 [Xylariaceae sp. FL0662B]|nr:hypothetical protein F4779DRAFT_622107 [Xylariaceae sp. FL0662B]
MVKKQPPKSSKPARAAAAPAKPAAETKRPAAAKAASPTTEDEEAGEEAADLKRQQQTLLNIFADAFADVLPRGGGGDDDNGFNAALREVKQALFDRAFERAFARDDLLDVYAARWSPTRALCYSRVLRRIAHYLQPLLTADEAGTAAAAQKTDGVLAIGGGAAEIVAFAAYLHSAGDGDVAAELALLDTGPSVTLGVYDFPFGYILL